MITLIPYTPGYESTLARFVIAFFGVHHSDVSFAEARETLAGWAKDCHRLFVICLGDEAAGFIRVHSTSPAVSWIDDVYVDAPHRGKGVATQAIRQVEAALRAEGARSFCMEVVPDNLPAMRLYHRLGYDRLSLITMRKDDEPYKTDRTESIAGLPLRVKKFE